MVCPGASLLGFLEVFDIRSIDKGDFYVKFWLRNRSDGFLWVLVAVYGRCTSRKQRIILNRVGPKCAKEKDHVLVGEDFNIIRSP